jgi:hypothetical protein
MACSENTSCTIPIDDLESIKISRIGLDQYGCSARNNTDYTDLVPTTNPPKSNIRATNTKRQRIHMCTQSVPIPAAEDFLIFFKTSLGDVAIKSQLIQKM